MGKGRHVIIVLFVVLFVVAAILRLHNAWVQPPLSGFDGPFHGTYVGILHDEGRLPLPGESWSTFHPPLYYLLCAAIWSAMPDAASPRAVLFALRMLNVLAGLGIGLAAFGCARRLFPERPHVAVYALALTLFLPMHIGPAATLGNELFAAALGAASLYAFVRWLPTAGGSGRSVAVGLFAGLAVLAKVSSLSVLAALGLIACVRGVERAGWHPRALRGAAIIGLAALLASGFYFGRNLARDGTPVVMQTEVVREVMKRQGYGRTRPLAGYLSTRHAILLDPATNSYGAHAAVFPVTFASVWFDLYGTMVDVASPWARRAARVTFVCGALVSGFVAWGAFSLLVGRARSAVPLAGATLLTLAAVTLVAYIGFTWQVATATALKGTYLSPGVVAFALLAAVGCDQFARTSRAARGGVHAMLAVLVVTVVAIFWSGWLAPLRLNPAGLYLRPYSDAATERVYEYFVGPVAEIPARER